MGLLGSVGGSVAAGDAAEHHEVAHGIAADAVAAVHTAGGLTGCIQAGDDAAVGVQHLCVGVIFRPPMVWWMPGAILMA